VLKGTLAVPITESQSKSIRPQSPATEWPLYGIGDVAHHLALPRSTVKSWVIGETSTGFQAVIAAADREQRILSFQNLVEVFFLSSLRKHGVKLPAVRRAISYMQEHFHTARPLFDSSFFTDGHNVFIEQYGRFISASERGQLAMKAVLEQYLDRLEFDSNRAPARLFPWSTAKLDSPRIVVIDPGVSFGQPCISGTRILTAVIAERFRAGDEIEALAADYQCNANQIEETIRYESRATAA